MSFVLARIYAAAAAAAAAEGGRNTPVHAVRPAARAPQQLVASPWADKQ